MAYKPRYGLSLEAEVWAFAMLVILSIVLLCAVIFTLLAYQNRISEERALPVLRQIAKTERVYVTSHTNNIPITGHPGDVTFELTVDGKQARGHCTKYDKGRKVTCTLTYYE